MTCFCGGTITTHKDRAMCVDCCHLEILPAARPDCSVDGCNRESSVRGWCSKHYRRCLNHGDPTFSKRRKAGYYEEYIRGLRDVEHDECIDWPFSFDGHGYGNVRFRGRHMSASRVCAIIFHGEPSHRGLDAAHSCGNSKCINPHHIRWATKQENADDRTRHGTQPMGERNGRSKLNTENVLEIRARVRTERAALLAEEFGVSRWTIYEIKNRRKWAWLK